MKTATKLHSKRILLASGYNLVSSLVLTTPFTSSLMISISILFSFQSKYRLQEKTETLLLQNHSCSQFSQVFHILTQCILFPEFFRQRIRKCFSASLIFHQDFQHILYQLRRFSTVPVTTISIPDKPNLIVNLNLGNENADFLTDFKLIDFCQVSVAIIKISWRRRRIAPRLNPAEHKHGYCPPATPPVYGYSRNSALSDPQAEIR